MEKILEIKPYTSAEKYDGMEGFEVVTDKQSIKLMISSGQSCCERSGYFWCNDNPQDFVGADVIGVRLTDTALNQAQMDENALDPGHKYFEGGCMFVDIETSIGPLQSVAYNEHNGYYGHEARVVCSQLKHRDVL